MPVAPRVASNTNRQTLLAACFAVNIIYGAYLGAIGVLLPQIGQTFHINSAEQGKIMSAGFAGSILSVLICGFLSDQLGRKRVMVGTCALFSAGLLLVGSARAELFALCSAPLIGAGSAGAQTVASALAADLYPAARGKVLNACQVAFAAGAVVGPGAVYLLLACGAAWRSVYIGMGAMAAVLACALAMQKFVVSFVERESPLSAAGVIRLLWQPAFVGLCTAQLLYAGAEVGFFEWMPSYFKLSLHGAGAWVGNVVSIFWIAMMAGRLAMGLLLGRFETLKLGIFLAGTGALGALLALCADRPLIVIVFVAQTGLCFGGIYSAILVEAGDRFHSSSVLGTVVGGIAAASCVGTSTVPWAVGSLAASTGNWRIGLSLVPLSALLAAFVLMFVRARRDTLSS